MDWTRCHVIGHGSSATVSLATSNNSGEVFAVKSVELSNSGFLEREQRILSSVSSPYIIGYKGCDITTENSRVMYNLFMDYAPAGTITDQVKGNGGRFDELTIGDYTRQILLGLDYLHSNGLVHCDIKGRNVLVAQSGVKIADFGCAKWVNAAEPDSGRISGTPAFMAPEVARGEEQGFPSDIWALGCTIIEMATGGSPWSNVEDPVSVIYRIGYSGELPEFPCFLSEQARDFLEKCLRRDPKERWTAADLLKHPFIAELKQIEESESNSNSNSPTSVLDQSFWNSVGAESESLENLDRTSSEDCAYERIRRLSLISPVGPIWGCDDESWMTIRGNDSEDDIGANCGMIGDCDLEEEESNVGFEDLLGFLDHNDSNCRISRLLLGLEKCGRDSVVISNLKLESHIDTLLFHSMRT
ncbi:mitogen-activated protein kinase kinase kinase 18-like [Tripterygium wilfordii]|uniref:mitogen-activated protein kinase kinase kinase 18-like n=1 Tax=Tripterygium wilfordii TaxID=458696 RepID=UPI0018F81CC6|nr:mitogen-activated protein kinase kinase kinase 18-like [Tripterygium wilfordii]